MTEAAGKPLTFLSMLILIVPMLAGCGAAMRQSDTGRDGETSYIDPFGFGDEFSSGNDRLIDTPVSAENNDAFTETPDNNGGYDDAASPQYNHPQTADVYGYRIHLGVFDSKQDADRMADYARTRLDVPVYTVYVPPFYRVHAGDFGTREDATEYSNMIKNIDRRFNNAYPLQTPINTP